VLHWVTGFLSLLHFACCPTILPAHAVEHDQEHAVSVSHHRMHYVIENVFDAEHLSGYCSALRPIAQRRSERLIHLRPPNADGVLEQPVGVRQRLHVFTARERFTGPINKRQVITIATCQMAHPSASQ
jgi:hypothetical protein